MELRDVIAKNISSLRIAKGLTQLQLADILNYSDKAVSKWERGESVPDVFMLKRIADEFGVTVDYLLAEEHTQEIEAVKTVKRFIPTRTRVIVSFLSASLVWLIATLVFVFVSLFPSLDFPSWIFFICAIPITCIVILVFNSIWGRKRLNYLIISLLVWSLILAIYICILALSSHNVWMLFLLGVPAQLIIVLWSFFGSKKARESVGAED